MMTPIFSGPPPPFGLSLIVLFGVGLKVLGLAWMIRLYPRDAEARPSSSRAIRHR
jgi:hypothetical protein